MFYAAKALMTLQALYGVIPNLYGKGECAAVCMSVLRFKTELSFASALFISHVLVLIAETEEELIKRLNEWKENVESKGMRVNMNKTKENKWRTSDGVAEGC